MAQDHVAEPFARRRRESVRDARRYYAGMLVLGLVILAATVAPTVWGWWQTAVPAAIGTAIFIFVLITIVGSLPMHSRAYVWPYFDCDPGRIPHPGERFGRALFRFSGVLDGWAREAGLSPITDFESPDVMSLGKMPHWPTPQWHDAAALKRTVDHLVTRAREGSPLHAELVALQATLDAACAAGARCYLLVATLGGGTNARVEAIRRGEKA